MSNMVVNWLNSNTLCPRLNSALIKRSRTIIFPLTFTSSSPKTGYRVFGSIGQSNRKGDASKLYIATSQYFAASYYSLVWLYIYIIISKGTLVRIITYLSFAPCSGFPSELCFLSFFLLFDIGDFWMQPLSLSSCSGKVDGCSRSWAAMIMLVLFVVDEFVTSHDGKKHPSHTLTHTTAYYHKANTSERRATNFR